MTNIQDTDLYEVINYNNNKKSALDIRKLKVMQVKVIKYIKKPSFLFTNFL
jgi:hypothetical protein